jgi:hypothetical protein
MHIGPASALEAIARLGAAMQIGISRTIDRMR